jgi:iron complex outermembrane receptor protein
MNSTLYGMYFGAAAALSLTVTAPTNAQDAAATQQIAQPSRTGPPDLGEIIVTARRVEESLQDVPISITVFTQQTLTERNIVNAQDLAAITPSLSSDNSWGDENSSFAIRGFTQQNGTQPTVGVYFADVVAPRGASNNLPIGDGAGPGSFFDLQNVQVLNGPQGTLFGRNTTGGAVLLVPQKPTAKQEGYAEISYGNYDMKRIQVVENLPISDIARFRIGVDRMDRDGYLNNDTGIGSTRFDGIDYLAVRASLVVDLSPDLENYQIFSYTHSATTGTDQKLVACDATNPFFGALACPALARQQGTGFDTVQSTVPNPFTRLTQFQLINTTTWHANDLFTVKNIVSYAELKEAENDMLFGTDFNLADLSPVVSGIIHVPVTLPSIPIDFAEVNAIPGGETAHQSTMTDELQVQARSRDGRFVGQGGVYVEESDPLSLTGSQSPIFINCSNLANLQCTDASIIGLGSVNYTTNENYFHDLGVYGQGTYSLTDQLKLTGGARYTMDSASASGQLISYQFPTPNTPVAVCSITSSTDNDCRVHYDERSHAPTWLVDLEYKPLDDILGYLKYSRGYRAGGISLQAPTGYNTFKPEKVDTYEAGLKTSFNGAVSGTFNITGFYNNFSDQQLSLNLLSLVGGAPASSIFNAGKSRIYGADIGASINPFAGFSLYADYTYLNTMLQSVTSFPALPGSSYSIFGYAKAGDELTLAPKNKYSITASYALPLAENIGRISLSVNFVHTDKQLANYIDGNFPAFYGLSYLAARNLLNADLGWKGIGGSHVDLSFFGTNLTNQQYYTAVGGIAPDGFDTVQLSQPRMFGGRIRYSF